jgi:hypothetical protein
LLLAFAGALLPLASRAALVADYRLQNNLASAVAGAPQLAAVNAASQLFANETVGAQVRRVLEFGPGSGLQLPDATSIVGAHDYTIAILFRFDDVASFQKVVDFQDRSQDDGLYVTDGFLDFFIAGGVHHAGAGTIAADQYVVAVLTAGPSSTVGYLDGVQQFSFLDEDGGSLINGGKLHFFLDDAVTLGTEISSGAVARIEIFDAQLSAEEVAALDLAGLLFGDGFESGNSVAWS